MRSNFVAVFTNKPVMKNPILLVSVGLLSGILLQGLAGYSAIWLLTPSLLFSTALYAFTPAACLHRKAGLAWISAFLLAIVLGFGLYSTQSAQSQPNPSLSDVYSAWSCEATAASQPCSMGFRTPAIAHLGEGSVGVYLYTPATCGPLAMGQTLIAEGALQSLSGPDGFVQYSYRQGIHFSLKVQDFALQGRMQSFFTFASDCQQGAVSLFHRHFQQPTAGLLSALILGDKSGLDSGDRASFATSGLSHVLAISGLHVGIIFSLLMGFMRQLPWGRRGHFLPSLLVLLFLWAYAVGCGFSPAIVRAVVLISLFQLAEVFQLQVRKINLLAIAAMCMLLIHPQWAFDAGFQLSFAATAAILTGAQWLESRIMDRFSQLPRNLASNLAVTMVAQAATAPLIVLHFGTFPTWFLFSNLLIALPALWTVRFGFLALIFLWIPGINTVYAFLLDSLTQFLQLIPKLIAQLPFATVHQVSFSDGGFLMLLAMILGILLLAFWPTLRATFQPNGPNPLLLSSAKPAIHLAAGLIFICFVLELIA